MASFVNNYTPSHKLLKLDTLGAMESTVTFHTGTESSSQCPSILVQQQDDRVIAASLNKMYRFDSEINLSTAEIRSCSNFSQMSNTTEAIIQPDDKIVVAGRYTGGGNLMLVRVLAN